LYRVVKTAPGVRHWRTFCSLADSEPDPEGDIENLITGDPREQTGFLALEGERAVARLWIWMSEMEGVKTGVIGLFESRREPAAVGLLFKYCFSWLETQDVRRAIGPINGDTWHRYRFNLGPFEESLFPGEPFNPSFYPAFWESSGFQIKAWYLTTQVRDIEGLLSLGKGDFDRILADGFTFSPLDTTDFSSELDRLYQLSLSIFSTNPFYREISRISFSRLYGAGGETPGDMRLWFCRDAEGRDAGFIFSYPHSTGETMGSDGNHQSILNIKTVGILPRYRKRGLAHALTHLACREGMYTGSATVNFCLFHEDNPSGRLDGGVGTIIRKYALYECRIPRHEEAGE